MKQTLIVLVSVLSLILSAMVYYGIRHLLKVIREHAMQKADLHRMRLFSQSQELRLQYHEDRHSLWVEMREELVEAWKGKGLGLGIMQSVEETQKLAAQLGQEKAGNQIAADNVANYRTQLDLDRKKMRSLSQTAEQLEGQRNEARDRAKALQEELLKAKKQLQTPALKPYDDSSQDDPKIVPLSSESRPKASESRPSGVRNASDSHPKAVQDGFGTDDQPEVLEYIEDDYYVMQDKIEGIGWKGKVLLKHKLLDEVVGEFHVSDLRPGAVHIVKDTSIRVVRCALPSCYKVKITKQMNTRCCSREHTRELEKLEAKKAKHA